MYKQKKNRTVKPLPFQKRKEKERKMKENIFLYKQEKFFSAN